MLPMQAALVDLFILDTFGSPVVESSPTFTFSSTTGYRLFLSGQVANNWGALPVGGISVPIGAALTYNSTNSGSIDQGESYSNFASYVNSEIGKLDDVGFVQEGTSDAALNLDYGDNASVLFNIPPGGLSKLLIAEDAGLDPFKLEYCTGVNSGCSTIFNGWTSSVQSYLAMNNFGLNDTPSNIDQAFLFVFDAPLTGYFRVTETTNPDSSSARLEIDFIGGVTPNPEPGYFVVIGLGIAGSFWLARRRKLAE